MMNLLSVNRVAFTIFGQDIYWYGVIITSAIIVAFLLAFILCKRRNLSTNIPYEIIIAILPLGILSARLFSVLFDSGLTIADYFKFREGGMSIIGAVIGGGFGLVLLCLIRKRSFLELADILVTVLILAQAIGRWGNYFNSEVYGQLITDPKLQFFPYAVMVGGQYYEALFFYEFCLNLLGFVGLMCLYWYVKPRGIVTGSYLIYYGTIRFILEPRRQSEFILRLGSVPISQIMSGIMVAIGVSILIYSIVKAVKNKKEQTGETEKVLHTN